MGPKTTLSFFLLALLFVVGGWYILTVEEPPEETDTPEAKVEPDLEDGPEAVVKTSPSDGRNFVIWLSIDGLHVPDLETTDTPFFDFMKTHGAYSLQHRVVFPSVTFASHVSQATGVFPGQHGIVANRFYDHETGRIYSYPGQASLLNAEPIWNTAQRQGVRVAVSDWTLSHQQQGPDATSYFGERYERGLRDRERLWQVLDIWREDRSPETLRLLMGYAVGPDSPGHAYGPGSPEVLAAIQRVDGILLEFYDTAVAFFETFREEGDQLIFVVSSDHGMSPVHSLVHPGHLTGLDGEEGVVAVHSANLLHLYFVDANQRETLSESVREAVDRYDFATVFTRAQAEERWQYGHPSRTGDLIVVLETGYTFSRRPDGVTQGAEEGGGPVGMHGYDPADDPNMNTAVFFLRYPEKEGKGDLGLIDSRQLHPTVADLLGVEPSAEATVEPLILFYKNHLE
ncbi:MAG: alkaline phosphatase family protein [Opitutales bacterium]|nr:alkaline phosphatase family protein [Opitutales bacterium]MCH8540178.1 alkaline phosphatase family protein [Opitutales bacterium]